MAANCEKTIIIMGLEKRRFVNKLDFLTSIGFGDGSARYREKAGVMGSGPYRVITQLGVYGFDDRTKRLKLASLHPGITIEEVKENSGFEIIVPEKFRKSPEPTAEHLRILREEIDPAGIVLGK